MPFVGRAVPHVRAGIGAVCTQASTMVEYGPRGLDLMAKGVEPSAAIAQLLSDDQQRESRQLGMIDMKGRSAAHTGKGNSFWAGSKQGKNYTVQANIMVGPEVVEAVAATFEASEGTGMPLAERMILAMEAGQAKGGDSRWGNLQSAAIKVADPNDPGRGGDHITLAIEVGEHPEPVAEMKRIYYTTGRRLGYRAFSRVEGADVIELKRMLHAIGYWRPSLAAFPDAPPNANAPKMQELRKANPGRLRQGHRRSAPGRRPAYTRDYAVFDDEAIAAVDKFRADRKLNYQGNPPGLVDQRFVDALEGRVSRETQVPLGAIQFVTASITRRDVTWAAASALVTLALFVVTLRPDVGGTEDSPKFQFVGQALGTAHSPGYPFYVMATWLFSGSPIDTLAYRVNLFSAVCGALSCLCIFLTARRLGVTRLLSFAAALAAATSYPVWSNSVTAEVYTLAAVLSADCGVSG